MQPCSTNASRPKTGREDTYVSIALLHCMFRSYSGPPNTCHPERSEEPVLSFRRNLTSYPGVLREVLRSAQDDNAGGVEKGGSILAQIARGTAHGRQPIPMGSM